MAGTGAAACLMAKTLNAEAKLNQDAAAAAGQKTETAPPLAAPCGIYCGTCPAYVDEKCHGICGCSCGKCVGAVYAKQCAIAKCVFGRKMKSCADCPELPCSKLIAMTADLLYSGHRGGIENLRRRKKIGDEVWLAEQKELWSDPKRRDLQVKLIRETWQKAAEYQK